LQEPEEWGWTGEGQVITTNQKRDPLQRLSRQRVDTYATRSALKAWRRAAGSSRTWYRKSFFCFRSGCYLFYTRPEGARGRSQVCSERRRVSLDPRSVTTCGVGNAAVDIHAVRVGNRPPGRGGSSPPGLSDEGLPWSVGACRRSAGDDAGPLFPLICMYTPGPEWILD